MFAFIVTALIVVVIAIAFTRVFVQTVPEGQQAVLVRLGQTRQALETGPRFVLPGLETVLYVSTAPQRFVTSTSAHTSDGATVQVQVAAVVRVVDALAALGTRASLDARIADAVTAAVGEAIAELSVGEVARKRFEIADGALLRAADALAAVGVTPVSITVLKVRLPAEVDQALVGTATAHYRRDVAVFDAETQRRVSSVTSRARADALRTFDRVARDAGSTTVDLERIDALRSAAVAGRTTLVAGFDPWGTLPPPDAASRLG